MIKYPYKKKHKDAITAVYNYILYKKSGVSRDLIHKHFENDYSKYKIDDILRYLKKIEVTRVINKNDLGCDVFKIKRYLVYTCFKCGMNTLKDAKNSINYDCYNCHYVGIRPLKEN